MTEAEKKVAREMLARQRVGWDYLESERREVLRKTVTKDAIRHLESSFAYAQTLPARTESGFVEFYRALGRASGRCSI